MSLIRRPVAFCAPWHRKAARTAATTLLLLASSVQAATWLPLRDRNLEIAEGSALDFSSLVAHRPAGSLGRVTVTADGHLAFASQSNRAARFMCASTPYGVEAGFPSHDIADRYAVQLRRHGYNLARFTFVENVLMHDRDRDFDFDPEQLDRFHYFLAALKREGIYWLVDGMTSSNGAYGGIRPHRWVRRHNIRLDLYHDEAQLAHWKRLVTTLYGMPNPYTGMTTLQDPALAGVILTNEGGLGTLTEYDYPAWLAPAFATWLRSRYGTTENLARAWGRGLNGGLAAHESLESGEIDLPAGRWVRTRRMADLQLMFTEIETRTLERMVEHLRSRGYPGLVTSFNNWTTMQAHRTRAALPWVDMHDYHDSPSNFSARGSRIRQTSSIESGPGYLGRLATDRDLGRPFTVTEHGQVFWNTWRREAGLAVGAYAALQGWDMICQHASGPIELAYNPRAPGRRDAIYPYGVGMDPIARAGETLAALLFLRGDVRPSPHRIGIAVDENYAFRDAAGVGMLPADLTNLAFLAGVGLSWQDRNPAARSDLLVEPGIAPVSRIEKAIDRITIFLGNGKAGRLAELINMLKAGGILDQNNATDADRRIFESDTGQILRNERNRTMQAVTPTTEAVVFDANLPVRLRQLTVESADGPALIAVSSLDGMPLDRSRRMLLIAATDAINSDMRFAGADRRELVQLGHLPVLVRSLEATLTLRHNAPGSLALQSLRLDGSPGDSIPVRATGNAVSFRIDTAALRHGPALYFELSDRLVAMAQAPSAAVRNPVADALQRDSFSK